MNGNSPNFHRNALQAMIVAINEGRQSDSAYVKKLAYEFYDADLKEQSQSCKKSNLKI